MPKSLSAEPDLRFYSSDIVQKALKVRDEGEGPLPVEKFDAPVVVLARDVKVEACFAFIIVETEN